MLASPLALPKAFSGLPASGADHDCDNRFTDNDNDGSKAKATAGKHSAASFEKAGGLIERLLWEGGERMGVEIGPLRQGNACLQ